MMALIAVRPSDLDGREKNITSNNPVDIRPPYYALAYIIKL